MSFLSGLVGMLENLNEGVDFNYLGLISTILR